MMALFPYRRTASTEQGLRNQPGVEIVSRDQANVYAEAITRATPQAALAADRWRLRANRRNHRYFCHCGLGERPLDRRLEHPWRVQATISLLQRPALNPVRPHAIASWRVKRLEAYLWKSALAARSRMWKYSIP